MPLLQPALQCRAQPAGSHCSWLLQRPALASVGMETPGVTRPSSSLDTRFSPAMRTRARLRRRETSLDCPGSRLLMAGLMSSSSQTINIPAPVSNFKTTPKRFLPSPIGSLKAERCWEYYQRNQTFVTMWHLRFNLRLNLSSPDVRESPLRGRSRRRELLHQNSISGVGDSASVCSGSSQSRLRHQTLAYGVQRGDLDRAADMGTGEGLQISNSEKVNTKYNI